MNIEIKEIICTCNICGTQYEDIQSIVNGFLTEKFHMCPECIKGVNLKKMLEDVEKQ